jgi:protein-tyrosine kinase
MGRVYDALKRAEGPPRANTSSSQPSGNVDNVMPFVPRSDNHHPWERAAFTGMPSVFDSASTAHTGEATGGPALPDGNAFRDAGATLGAVGSARAVEFSSRDISTARVEPHLVAVTDPHSRECEEFRSLRTRILQAGERDGKRAFVITSANMGEGKTLTAVNLAWLLAQTDGATALIIDADLRNPCAAAYLGMDADRGLSEVLTGETKLTQAIIKLNPAGLHVLPGGSRRDDVAELLSGPRFSNLLDEARKLFDYIIIDAPPMGIFTDANVLISRADAAVLVLRAGSTKFSVIDRLLEQVPRERLLGVVLNRANVEVTENYYYYYSDRQRAVAAAQAAGQTGVEEPPEMIYIEEDGVS